MKVRYLKDHNNNKAGDEVNVPDGTGQYLIRCGVAEPANEKQEIPVQREKVEIPKGKEKKQIRKP